MRHYKIYYFTLHCWLCPAFLKEHSTFPSSWGDPGLGNLFQTSLEHYFLSEMQMLYLHAGDLGWDPTIPLLLASCWVCLAVWRKCVMLLIGKSRQSTSRQRRWAAALHEADLEWLLWVVSTPELVIQLCLKYSYSVTLIVELCLSISVVSDLKKKKKGHLFFISII